MGHPIISGNLAQGFVLFHDKAYLRSAMLPVGCLSSAHVDPLVDVEGPRLEPGGGSRRWLLRHQAPDLSMACSHLEAAG